MTRERKRILAVILPHLLCELAQQRVQAQASRTPKPHTPEPRARASRARLRSAIEKVEPPRAIVLTDVPAASLEGKTELDAVNSTAQQLGVRPRQTLAQASAIVENLSVHALPRSRVCSALKDLAEVALGFGTPVSFQAPDTIWVDISGSSHLYPSEREVALELTAQIKALGHSTRIAVSEGPWLAQSFARYAQLEGGGILLVDPAQAAKAVGQLPIIALPIHREAVSWFSRLGLLEIDDLRKLPTDSLAARLEGQALDVEIGTILDLIQGQDGGILIPHHPEELPREELFWEDPLESVEPLLFVLKGLSARLSARLEGRGQAARELQLIIHYDRSIAALSMAALSMAALSMAALSMAALSTATPDGTPVLETKSLSFKLASPLFHAEDLERVMRLRLQRQSLAAPTLGLSLQATGVTEAKHCQLGLSQSTDWQSGVSADPRRLTVLVAELSSDVGMSSVGILATEESHLLEKSSVLLPLHASSLTAESLTAEPDSPAEVWSPRVGSQGSVTLDRQLPDGQLPDGQSLDDLALPRIPTRLLNPALEIHAPIRKHELWVLGEQAFVVSEIHFEQRLEGIEWWDRSRVFRDYFRVWLAVPGEAEASRGMARNSIVLRGKGIEALVYWDRERGKSYLHALYD